MGLTRLKSRCQQAVFLSGEAVGENLVSLLIQNVDKTQFLAVVGLRSPFLAVS